MPTFKFTEKKLQQLKTPRTKQRYWDEVETGLLLIHTPGDKRTFYFRYTSPIGGRKVEYRIGPFPPMALSQARKEVTALKALVVQGRCPQQERQHARREVDVTQNKVDVSFMIDEYEQHLTDRGRRNPHAQKVVLLRLLKPYLKWAPDELTAKTMQTIMDTMSSYQSDTVARNMGAIRSMYNFAKKRGLASDNPIDYVTLPSAIGNAPKRALDDDKIKGFIRALQEWDDEHHDMLMPYFMLMLYTGARPGETLALKWDDIDLQNLTIEFLAQNTKTSQHRMVKMNAPLKKILQTWRFQKRNDFVFPSTSPQAKYKDQASHPPKKLMARFHAQYPEYKDVWRKDMRTTAATLLINNPDIKPNEVQEQLGHAKLDTTLKHYTRLGDSVKTKLADALSKV